MQKGKPMPRKCIEYHKIEKCGNIRYRVIIPKALRATHGGVKARYFTTATDASSFVSELEGARDGAVSAFTLLPPDVQESAIRAVRTLGDFSSRIDEAATLFLHHLNQQPRQIGIVRKVIEECLGSKKAANLRPRYLTTLKHSLGRFALIFGDSKISDIAPVQIEQWLNGNAWAAASRRSYLTDVRTLFSFAKNRGYVFENMAARVQLPSFDNKAPCILTVKQTKALLRATLKTDKALAPYVAICLFAGVHPEEAAKLTKADVLNGHIQIASHKAKTHRRRLVDILPVLREWLNLGGEMPPGNLRKRFEAVREAAGLVSIERKGEGREERQTVKQTGWGHDCMRHSFASYHLAKFKNAGLTSLQLGHGSQDMLFEHYREIVLPEQAEAFFALTPKAVTAKARRSNPTRRQYLV